MRKKTAGSICSGIEAATVALNQFDFKWYSEIDDFPSKVLEEKYPKTPNIGDMLDIPGKLASGEIDAPDFLCGGTPCQAFSLAGLRNGLADERGNLTLAFVKIVIQNDLVRIKKGLPKSIVFWENVKGVLKDKTNAFGSFISSLAGFDNILNIKDWPDAGIIRGPERNVAWRVLDAKYFGIPQQRKRVYVLAGGKDFFPEDILFEEGVPDRSLKFLEANEESKSLTFQKDGISYEVFRPYTDTLYAAYGTKWNGNAAAYNGSLYVVQDNRLRRLSPLECERLMGFPDGYTDIKSVKRSRTKRYKALGNSWAVPVIKWIGNNLDNNRSISKWLDQNKLINHYIGFNGETFQYHDEIINTSDIPNNITKSSMKDIVDKNAPEKIYITSVGCAGILRRKRERKLHMNPRLEQIMENISAKMSSKEIEKRSRVQQRGAFSQNLVNKTIQQIKLF